MYVAKMFTTLIVMTVLFNHVTFLLIVISSYCYVYHIPVFY